MPGCRQQILSRVEAASVGRLDQGVKCRGRLRSTQRRAAVVTLAPDGARKKKLVIRWLGTGARWPALHQPLLGSCALAGITDPRTHLRDVLTKLSRSWPHSRLGDLVPAGWLAARAIEG